MKPGETVLDSGLVHSTILGVGGHDSGAMNVVTNCQPTEIVNSNIALI
jgi:hypothetical protein